MAEELIDDRTHPALEECGLARSADGLKQLVVLHVAGPSEHVAHSGDDRHVPGAMPATMAKPVPARGGEHLEAELFPPL